MQDIVVAREFGGDACHIINARRARGWYLCGQRKHRWDTLYHGHLGEWRDSDRFSTVDNNRFKCFKLFHCYLCSVQSLSRVRLFATPWIAACQASLSITNSQSLLKLMSIQPSHPLSSPLLLPPIPPSIRVFSNESTLCMRWPKYWSFSFSISPSNEYSGLIFRMDWLDLLAVQGTLKSLLQHHSLKASILRHSAFFIIQLSHPYMTTVRNHSLD